MTKNYAGVNKMEKKERESTEIHKEKEGKHIHKEVIDVYRTIRLKK